CLEFITPLPPIVTKRSSICGAKAINCHGRKRCDNGGIRHESPWHVHGHHAGLPSATATRIRRAVQHGRTAPGNPAARARGSGHAARALCQILSSRVDAGSQLTDGRSRINEVHGTVSDSPDGRRKETASRTPPG